MASQNSSAVLSKTEPKIHRKLVLRTLGLVVVLGVLLKGFQYWQSVANDLDGRQSSNTVGYVAALKALPDGGWQAVLIKPDGSVQTDPDYKAGSTDRDIAWSPDGNFLYYVSDRNKGVVNVFRWGPDSNHSEPRTVGSRGRGNPAFSVEHAADQNDFALITSGGNVLELDPHKASTTQVLPPREKEISQTNGDDESDTPGSGSQFGPYAQLGESFRVARWCKKKTWIAAVMRRDQGEVLVLQNLTPVQGKLAGPQPVLAADKIDFDVNPNDGTVVFAAQGVQGVFDPKGRFDPRVRKIFRHLLAIIDPDSPQLQPIMASAKDEQAFATPVISPDGSQVLVEAGVYSHSEGMSSKALVVMPDKAQGGTAGAVVIRGEAYEPSWAPSGKSLAFAQRVSGKRSIFTVNIDGTNPKRISDDKFDYAHPLMSPQVSP